MDELRQQFEAAFPQSGGALVAQPKDQTQNGWGHWPDDLMGKAIKALTLFSLSFIAAIPLAFLYVQFGQTHSDTNVRRNAQSTVEVQPNRTDSAL
jgi:hypothetical protein